MKYKNFEEYLQFKHAEGYHGTDDNMPNAYDAWLETLDVNDILEMVKEYEQT